MGKGYLSDIHILQKRIEHLRQLLEKANSLIAELSRHINPDSKPYDTIQEYFKGKE